jgi:hypothetical protein
MEQIQSYQIVGGAGGGSGPRMQTFVNTLSGGSSSFTFNASFVVGPVLIEVITNANDNGGTVIGVAHGTVAHFGSGSKNSDVSNRRIAGIANGPFLWFSVERNNSGTRIIVGRPNTGTPLNIDGTGAESFAAENWPSTGRIRVTVIEDTSS